MYKLPVFEQLPCLQTELSGEQSAMSQKKIAGKSGKGKAGKIMDKKEELSSTGPSDTVSDNVSENTVAGEGAQQDKAAEVPASSEAGSVLNIPELETCTPASLQELDCPGLYINREINWLEFNERVLECALDPKAPLLEQLKFLCIFCTNLDEFFMVRVSNIIRQYRNAVTPTGPDRMSSARQLAEIRRRVMALTGICQDHWRKKLSLQLADRGLKFSHYDELSEKQRRYLHDYFNNEIYPVLTPQAIDPSHPFPTISNLSLNFLILLKDKTGQKLFARVRCPGNVPRLIFVPRGKKGKSYAELGLVTNMRDTDILLFEEMVQEYLGTLFPGYEVVSSGCFRITRNTDVEIEEDEADDLLQAVKDLVDQRRFGDVVRLETAHGMPADLREFLIKKLRLKPYQVYTVRGPMAFSDLMALYSADRPNLKLDNVPGHVLHLESTFFARLREGDILLHHPYESFTPILDFIQSAAVDPSVIAIKQTLYRVGNNSPIVKSLVEARRRGKQVTAVVELKARFDEERNITWAEELEAVGVNVVYGIVGMKIHAKLCLVVRREEQGVTRYVHIGTGNYNPNTAKIYTDMGLLTCNPDICADVTDLFNVMTGYARQEHFRRILVSPVSMRSGLLELIRQEVDLHREFGGGEIILKCNQLVDKELIKTLYQASQAGVRVQLVVRGICCLRPGIPGISENITVRSIVGRYLEHVRAYWFRAGGAGRLYIGSADLMPRNLDRRIEVCVPILDESKKAYIRNHVLGWQLADNQQSWEMQADGSYVRVVQKEGEEAVNAQEMLLKEAIAVRQDGTVAD